MTINVGKFVSTVHQENLNLLDEKNLLIYARTIQQLKLGAVFAVNSFSDLPCAQTNTGKLYYVKNNEELFYSNGGLCWNRLSATCSTLYTWGRNNVGQLATGNIIDICVPTIEFCECNNFTNISASNSNIYVINNFNQLWSAGGNTYGQIGDGFVVARCSFVREFCSANDWSSVSAGNTSVAAIKTNGQLWTWGSNSNGQLGIGSSATIGRCSPVREFCSATDWCRVSAGNEMMAAIKTTGELWVWGRNCFGILGIGSSATLGRCSPIREFCSATDWCLVSIGSNHSAAIKTSGQAWTWGQNNNGQLGIGSISTTGTSSPVREFCSATDWCQVSAWCSTIALKTSGQLWGWGFNLFGELGIGNTIERCSPVREFCSASDWCSISSKFFTVSAINTSGHLWTWGRNCFGTLGIGDSATIGRCSPVREFSSATDWCQVSVGYGFMVALKKEKYF